MKSPMSEDLVFPAYGSRGARVFCLGLLIGALALGCAWGLSGRSAASARAGLSSPEGDLEVSYTVQENPSTAIGSTITGVTSIEFYPGYIVVTGKKGNGRTFFAARTNKLDWRWVE